MSLNTFALRLADELRIAVARAEDCQILVSHLAETAPSQDAMIGMQTLDALTQQLDALSGVFARLGAIGNLGPMPPDLLDGIVLTDMRRRLGGMSESVEASALEPELW